jgi:O-antigen/teichoic acid export membrane protein
VKNILSDTTFTGLSQLILSLSQIILQIFIVRFTSQQAFGEFVTANAIENLIEIIFITRSSELALQYVGKYWVAGDHIAARICMNRIIRLDWMINWSIYAFIIVFSILISQVIKFNPIYLIGLGLQIPMQIGYGVYKSIFISSSKIREQAVFEMSFSCTYIFLCLISVSWLGIPGLITAFVVSAFFKNCLARIITDRWWLPVDQSIGILAEKKDLVNAELWWNFSMHSMLRNTFISAANQVDVLILTAFKGPESTAIYKIARSLSSLPARVIAPIWSALRPRLMYAYHTGNSKQLLKLIVVPAAIMLGLLILTLVPIYFFADDLIVIMYGKSYVLSTLPFLILLIGTWFYAAITAWFNFWIVISNLMQLGTLISGFLLVTTLIMGILFGSKSIVSMAIAVSVSMVMTSILCWLVVIKYLRPKNL